MNQTAFLILYIIIALLFSGGLSSMWTLTVMALAFGQKGAVALLNPIFIISLLSPILLIVLTHMRGKRIGVSKLIWFPIAALALTLLPLLFGVLNKLLSGPGNAQPLGSIDFYATMFIATVSTVGPLILHTICCVLGGKRDPGPATSAATKRDV